MSCKQFIQTKVLSSRRRMLADIVSEYVIVIEHKNN